MARKPTYMTSPVGEGAKAVLEKQGFDFPLPPEEEVNLPVDVSDIDSHELMALFSLFTAWCDYAAAQVGLAVIAERECERAQDRAEAEAWRSYTDAKSVTAAKAMVAIDPDVAKARDSMDMAHAYRRLISDLAVRYERDAAVLSRELTRRTSENGPKEARRQRWTT
jgi:hypothetical protein